MFRLFFCRRLQKVVYVPHSREGIYLSISHLFLCVSFLEMIFCLKFYIHVSSDQNPCDVPLNLGWFKKRYPYNGSYNWEVFHPPYNPTNRGDMTSFFFQQPLVGKATIPCRIHGADIKLPSIWSNFLMVQHKGSKKQLSQWIHGNKFFIKSSKSNTLSLLNRFRPFHWRVQWSLGYNILSTLQLWPISV